MKGEQRKLENLLEGSKTRFEVPVYQRNYDWHEEHCKRLFDDLEAAVAKHKSHFFGGIVSQQDGDLRIVIDGQQRLTTVFLLLLALTHALEDGMLKAADPRLLQRVRDSYLTDPYHEEAKLKLKLIKNDDPALVRVYKQPSVLLEGSTVTHNYQYLARRIAAMACSADELLAAIENLEVIDITLREDDDPQLVFESLNSTGLELSDGDKIRNFVLMGLPPAEQEVYYDKYWHPIEQNTGFAVSDFIRFYLAAVNHQTPAIQRVYQTFKQHVGELGLDAVLEDLLKYSRYYAQLASAQTGLPTSDRPLRRLNLMGMSVLMPFLMSLVNHADRGLVGDAEMAEAIETIEIYLLRRWVCGVPTNALNKVFETLHGDVLGAMDPGDGYTDVLNYVLLYRQGSSRLPADEEFLSALDTRDFYHIPPRMRLYLWDRLENRDSVERVNVVGGLEDETLTVEHVMPQTLSVRWKEVLGQSWQKTHEIWLHRLANLTLTGYNSRYSNRDFETKRSMAQGFVDSGLRLNRWISKQDGWTLTQLEHRQRQMRRQALELWPLPTTSFVPRERVRESYGLDDELDFTGRDIAAYVFRGTRQSVGSWKAMAFDVLEATYESCPSVFQDLVEGTRFPASYFFGDDGPGRNEIAPSVYVDLATTTRTKLDLLRRVFEVALLDSSDLSFEIYERADGSGAE